MEGGGFSGFFSSVLLLARRSLYYLYNQTCHVTDGPKPEPRFSGSKRNPPFSFPMDLYLSFFFIGDGER